MLKSHGIGRLRRAAIVFVLTLGGCATFSDDRGMQTVAEVTRATVHKDALAIRSEDDAQYAGRAVDRLMGQVLSVDAAVQIALLDNRGLQASYNELALAEADLVGDSLPPNPVFSVSRIAGSGALEIERQVVGDILALGTLPARSGIARQRFRKAQLRAAEATLRLAADVRRAYYQAVAANELERLLADTQSTAESTARLAVRLGQTGSLNRLDQAREQAFYAETTAELGSRRQDAVSARERLTRLLGLWDKRTRLRLPATLPPLPRRPLSMPDVEMAAVEHRIDLQIARIELDALARSLGLATATRFVTLLEVAGIDRKTRDPDGTPFRERGFDLQFEIPIFDGGEVKVRQAAETYNQALNRLAERAVNIRSEAREAYGTYRSTCDVSAHYQREVLPLRKIISDEMQLRLNSMQVDVFAVLTEARQRVTVMRAAIEARRNFWLAWSDLQTAIYGGGRDDAGAGSGSSNAALATDAGDQ